MAGLARVFLDTSICTPISVLDLMLRCDEHDLHRIAWTEDLLAELELVWVRQGARSAESARGITDSIPAAFADQEVPRQTYSHLIAGMPGDDAADHQHAAAAVAIAPAILLTANLKHFPAPALAKLGVTVSGVDEYALGLLDDQPDELSEIIDEMSASRQRPRMTPDEIVEALNRAGLKKFGDRIRRG